MSYQTDIQRVIRQSEAQGFRVTRTTKGHYQFYSSNKKDIVIASGSPGGGNYWVAFMGEMKRAGYRENVATTSLAEGLAALIPKKEETEAANDALPAPQFKLGEETPPPPMSTKDLPVPRPSAGAVIREYLTKRGPLGANMDDIQQVVQVARGTVGERHLCNGATYQLKKAGVVEPLPIKGRGWWRIVTGESATPPKFVPAKSVSPPVKTAPPAHAASDLLSTDAIEEDIAKLDNLLNALSEAEGVLRRQRDVAIKLRELRELLRG